MLLLVLPVRSQQPTTPPAAGPDSEYYVKFGIANGESGNLNGAIKAFSEAIKIDPKMTSAYINRGEAYRLQHQLDEAIADYTQAIQLDPKTVSVYLKRGEAQRLRHKLDEAIADYTQAIQIDPKYQDAYMDRGIAKGEQGNFQEAITDFDHLIALNPQNGGAYQDRAHAKYLKGDQDGALADINQSIQLEPGLYYSYFLRGLIRHGQQDREGALADFQKNTFSGFAYGAFWAWIVKMENSERGIARQNLSDFLIKYQSSAPDSWPSQIGNFLLDKITQDQLIAMAKNDPSKADLCEAWFYIGISRRLEGDAKTARDCFGHAIETGAKNSEEYVEAQREMADIQKQ